MPKGHFLLGTHMAGIFASLSYVSDTKVEHLEIFNKAQSQVKQQLREQIDLLYNQKIDSYPIYNKLLKLRDSLSSAKRK